MAFSSLQDFRCDGESTSKRGARMRQGQSLTSLPTLCCPVKTTVWCTSLFSPRFLVRRQAQLVSTCVWKSSQRILSALLTWVNINIVLHSSTTAFSYFLPATQMGSPFLFCAFFSSPQKSKEPHFPCLCFSDPSVPPAFPLLPPLPCQCFCGGFPPGRHWRLSSGIPLFLVGIPLLVSEGWQSVFGLDQMWAAKDSSLSGFPLCQSPDASSSSPFQK